MVAVSGYHVCSNLFIGKHLYVDDLLTSKKYRSQSYSEKMVEWLKHQARKNNCNVLHLD